MPDQTAAPPPLWSTLRIPAICVAGEFGSGKTLFGLTIDPPNTVYYDFEKSGSTYEGLGIKKRVDVASEMLKLYPGGYNQVQLFLWWRDHVKSIKAGEYRVMFIDPISDIEQGFTDWVAENPQEFRKTEKQYEKAMGLLWGDMKASENMLLVDAMSRVETLCYAVHMGDVFKGGQPTGARKPKGKDTLTKLAHLSLLLERKPDKDGKVPAKPSAIVLKQRIAHTQWNLETMSPDIQNILPPRLPEATPQKVREYIAKPADYGKLKAGEKLEMPVFTEEMKLDKQREIAAMQLKKEELHVSGLELVAASAAKNVAAIEKASGGTVVVQQQEQPKTDEIGKVTEPPKPDTEPPIPGQTNDLDDAYRQQATMLEQQIGMTPEQRAGSYKKRGFESLATATSPQLSAYTTALREALQKRNAAPKA